MHTIWKRKVWDITEPQITQWTYNLNGLRIVLAQSTSGIMVHINNKRVYGPLPYWGERFRELEARWWAEFVKEDDGEMRDGEPRLEAK